MGTTRVGPRQICGTRKCIMWDTRLLAVTAICCCCTWPVAGQDNQRNPWDKKVDHVCSAGDLDQQWEEITAKGEFPGRSDMGCVAFDNKIVMAGGLGDSASNFALRNDVWSSEDGKSWKSMTDKAPWSARKNFGMVTYNKKLWIMGGLQMGANGKMELTNSIWSSTDGTTWSSVKGDSPYCVGTECAGEALSY